MEIKVLEIIWEKSQSVYRQGIKGEKNFRHREPKKLYNGHGGVHENIPRKLFLIGEDEERGEVEIDLTELLRRLGREHMSEKLYSNLQEWIPEKITIDKNKNISEDDLKRIIDKYNDAK